jgi:coenzyme F420-0:L-glutamate ligase / coenzyme F420-1:gamma-L-glutamate ligase
MRVEIVALTTIPEVRGGDDLAALIQAAAARENQVVDEETVIAVAQKIVSKAEGAVVDLRGISPSPLAQSWAAEWGKDPRLIELVLTQSRRIVKMDRGVLIAETATGLVCANAGVDQSNVDGADMATVLPRDPDASARLLHAALGCGAVLVTDTFGRPWREGLVDVAIGVSGMEPLADLRGTADRQGRKLTATVVAVADQLAAAAGLTMVKDAGCPVVLIRGYNWKRAEGSARSLVRDPQNDLFR